MAVSPSFQLVQNHSSDISDLNPSGEVNSVDVINLNVTNASNRETDEEL